jgi:hypothetical protein
MPIEVILGIGALALIVVIAFMSYGSHEKSEPLDEGGTEVVKVEATPKKKAPRKAPAKKKG